MNEYVSLELREKLGLGVSSIWMVFKTIRLDEIIKGHYVAIAEKGPRFKPWSTLQL